MHITELSVKGFRSLKDVRWKPGALNVLIGPNGGGKTNLLKVLEMLSASAQGGLSDFIEREGGTDALRWDGSASTVDLRVCVDEQNLYGDDYKFIYDLQLFLAFSVEELIQEEKLTVKEMPKGSVDSTYELLNRSGSRNLLADKHNDLNELELDNSNESLLSLSSKSFASYPASMFRRGISDLFINRTFDTSPSATSRNTMVSRHETKIDCDGNNLIQVLHTAYTTQRKFKQSIDDSMKAAFGVEFEELLFPPAGDQRIQLRVRWKSLNAATSAADLSDGTLRFLFLMAILANPEPPPLIAIDEPEAGLHPSMLPIIAEYAVAASEKTQVIFSTHSVSMLDAFRDVTPTTTVVECHDGATTLRTLDGDDLAYWQKEYTLGDLFRSGELENMAHETEASE